MVGPVPKPRTKREVARTMTSGLVLKRSAVVIVAALKMEDAKVTQRVGVAWNV